MKTRLPWIALTCLMLLILLSTVTEIDAQRKRIRRSSPKVSSQSPAPTPSPAPSCSASPPLTISLKAIQDDVTRFSAREEAGPYEKTHDFRFEGDCKSVCGFESCMKCIVKWKFDRVTAAAVDGTRSREEFDVEVHLSSLDPKRVTQAGQLVRLGTRDGEVITITPPRDSKLMAREIKDTGAPSGVRSVPITAPQTTDEWTIDVRDKGLAKSIADKFKSLAGIYCKKKAEAIGSP